MMIAGESPVVALHDAVAVAAGFPLLSGVTLELGAATLTVVTGANGAGKTSLLRLLGGLVPLSSGSGTVAGVDLASGDLRMLRLAAGPQRERRCSPPRPDVSYNTAVMQPAWVG